MDSDDKKTALDPEKNGRLETLRNMKGFSELPEDYQKAIELLFPAFTTLSDRITQLEEYMLYTHIPLMAHLNGKIMEESYVRDLFDNFHIECDRNSLHFVFGLMGIAIGIKPETE